MSNEIKHKKYKPNIHVNKSELMLNHKRKIIFEIFSENNKFAGILHIPNFEIVSTRLTNHKSNILSI